MSTIGMKKEFRDFGKYIQVAAILTIVSITTGVVGFVAMIFVFVAIASLKRINYTLNNSLLNEFRSNYTRAFISRIGGMIVLLIGGANLGMFFLFPTSLSFYILLSIAVILIISGIVIIYLGVAAEMKAWRNLKTFLENNSNMFPDKISGEAIKGCEKLRSGALLISLWFLIIPAIIGFIYQIQGYFMLATFRKLSPMDLSESQDKQKNMYKPQEDTYKPQEVLNPDEKVNFCPNCGAQLSELGKFCALC
ncbi:MAG: hypothetical protein P8Y23_01745, partial [Candidatus Lokiarchaeota archaeon]